MRTPVATYALTTALACAQVACAPVDSASATTTDVTPAIDVELDLAQLALVDDGPFVDDEGPAIVPCGAGGVIHEGAGRLEVRTAWCDPADLAMPLAVDLPAGTLVAIELSHAALFADGGEVHLAVVIGDGVDREVVWQSAQTLPVASAYVHERIALAADHFAGERVVVHVHNHGSNAYMLHGLRFTSP